MTAVREIKLLAENKNDMSIKKRGINLLYTNPLQSILEKLLRLFKIYIWTQEFQFLRIIKLQCCDLVVSCGNLLSFALKATGSQLCFVMILTSSLQFFLFFFLTKRSDCSKEGEVWPKIFQTQFLSPCHRRFRRLLSSAVPLLKFTNLNVGRNVQPRQTL